MKIVAFAAAAVLAVQTAAPGPAPAPLTDAQLAAEAGAVVAAWGDRGWFHGAVLVARGDRVIYRGAAGAANAAGSARLTPDSVFNVATITQLFTSVAILRLQERGRLRIDDTLGTHMSAWPDAIKALTIRQLLRNTSGLLNTPQIPALADMTVPRSTRDLAALIVAAPVGPPPDSPRQWSTNYALLAALIEQVTGKPYADVIAAEVIAPAGLRATSVDQGAKHPVDVAGMVRRGATITAAPAVDMSNVVGYANYRSTIDDVFRFARALQAGRLIGAPLVAQMTSDQLPPAEPARVVGGGFGVSVLPGASGYWDNTGFVSGFESNLTYVPSQDATLIILSNAPGGELGAVARGLRNALLGRAVYKPSAYQAVPPRPEDLAAVAGTWQMGGMGFTSSSGQRITPQVVVRVDGQRVYVRTPQLQAEEEWFASGPGTFFSPSFDQQIVLPGSPGGVARLVYFGSQLELRR